MTTTRHRLAKRAVTLYRIITQQGRHPLVLPVVTVIAVIISFFLLFQQLSVRHASSRKLDNASVQLVIAIGSAPANIHLRQAARDTWLTWLPADNSIVYRFFTDAPPSTRTAYAPDAPLWRRIAAEQKRHADLVLQPLPSGYGDKEHNAYGLRALFQASWAVQSFPNFVHFLRVDDDSFLCLHRLVYELKSVPRAQFFWGRFWCRQGRNRADENFMLFSSDVVKLLADPSITGKLLPFDPHVTLGWNFGYWSWSLNLTIFDDQERIDAQQGYLTKYMHQNDSTKPAAHPPSFCDSFLYAHHVPEAAMRAAFNTAVTHVMYPLPTRPSPRETCHAQDRSFIPARHSTLLPNVKIEPAS